MRKHMNCQCNRQWVLRRIVTRGYTNYDGCNFRVGNPTLSSPLLEQWCQSQNYVTVSGVHPMYNTTVWSLEPKDHNLLLEWLLQTPNDYKVVNRSTFMLVMMMMHDELIKCDGLSVTSHYLKWYHHSKNIC